MLPCALLAGALSACTVENPAFSPSHPDGGTGGAAGVPPRDAVAAIGSGGSGGSSGSGGSAGGVVPGADAARPADADLTTGLIGYWRMDEVVGATVVRDSSGLHNDGKLEVADPNTAWVSGKFGTALDFDDNDKNYGVRVEAAGRIASLTNYTLAAWVKRVRSRPIAYMSIMSRQLGTGIGELFDMSVSKDLLQAYAPDRTDQGVSVAAAKESAPVNVWFHAAATYDGSTIRIYQDGMEKGSVSWTKGLPSTTTPLYLGTNKNGTGLSDGHHPWEGQLDELLLYDVALPPAALTALADGERPAVP